MPRRHKTAILLFLGNESGLGIIVVSEIAELIKIVPLFIFLWIIVIFSVVCPEFMSNTASVNLTVVVYAGCGIAYQSDDTSFSRHKYCTLYIYANCRNASKCNSVCHRFSASKRNNENWFDP